MVDTGRGWVVGDLEWRSRRRTASSRESSSKGLRECLMPLVSMPVWDLLTRGFILGRVSGGLNEETGSELEGWAYSVVNYPFDGDEDA